jgi:hypothetical protein
MIELSIVVKDENYKLIEKDTVYHMLTLSKDDPWLKDKVTEATIKFGAATDNSEPDIDIIVTAKMVWQ